MSSKSTDQIRSHGPVRITLPASVANNKEALKKAIVSVVELSGCRTCFSGHDCFFSQARELMLSEDRKVTASPVPSPWHTAASARSQVNVAFQGAVAFNLDNILATVDKVVGVLGCLPCHSGFDVNYMNEVIQIGVDQNVGVTAYGGVLAE